MRNLFILLWRTITFPFVYLFQSLFGNGQDAVDIPGAVDVSNVCNKQDHTTQEVQGNEGLTVTQPEASYVSSDGMASLYFYEQDMFCLKVGLIYTALVGVAVYSSRSLGWMSENISIDGNGECPASYSNLSYSTPLTSDNEYFVASKQQMVSMDSSLIQWSKDLVAGRKHNSLPKATNSKIDVCPVSSQAFQAGKNYLLPMMMLSSSVLEGASQHQPNPMN